MTDKPSSSLKSVLLDYAFIGLAILAYVTNRKGINQLQLARLYEVKIMHPELELDGVTSALTSHLHGNPLYYFATSMMLLWYVYTKKTALHTKIVATTIAIIGFPLSFIFGRIS